MQAGDSATASSPIIVLGMHRGGTSAFAGLLHTLGVNLGPRLMPGAEGTNTKGFWEHPGIFDINERLYSALGRSRFDPREMPQNWMDLPAFSDAVTAARSLIERDFLASPATWAIKDPRMCRTLPVWLKAIEPLGLRPCIALVARHPHDVALSLQEQRWVDSPARSHVCWLQHMIEAERWSRPLPRVVVRFDALIDDWRQELARTAPGLGIRLSDGTPETDARIDGFIDARERHFDASERTIGESWRLPALVAETWTTLNGGADDSWKDIQRLADLYACGSEVLAPCLDEAIVEASLARHQVDASARQPSAKLDGFCDTAKGRRPIPAQAAEHITKLKASIEQMQNQLTDLVNTLGDVDP